MLNTFSNVGDVKISENYTQCTVKCYKETVLDDSMAFMSNILKCFFVQAVVQKKDSKELNVDCKYVDAITDEVIYHFEFIPGNEYNFDIDPDDFSSVRQGDGSVVS